MSANFSPQGWSESIWLVLNELIHIKLVPIRVDILKFNLHKFNSPDHGRYLSLQLQCSERFDTNVSLSTYFNQNNKLLLLL